MRPLRYTVAADRRSTCILDAAGVAFMGHFEFWPHYELVTASQYICFVPLITTWALLPEIKAPVDNNHHIFSLIHDHILKAAAEGRCLLVFDSSCEGDPFMNKAYHSLHTWLQENNIPFRNVLIVNQNRVLADQYQKQIGDGVRISHYDYFIKLLLNVFRLNNSEFASQMAFSADSIRFREREAEQTIFLCLNGVPRPHRIVMVAALLAKGILTDTTWSMLGPASKKLEPSEEAAKQLRTALGLNWVTDQDIHAICSEMPRVLSGEEQFIHNIRDSTQLALSINPVLFEHGFASIVTETEFSDGAVIRISEKALKPLAMGHPLILFGNPFSLRLLRELGFSTFGSLFDESYDTILNPAARFEAVVESITRCRELFRGASEEFSEAIRRICDHNISIARYGAASAYEESIERRLLNDILGWAET
jgi:hypothetical protein